MTYINVRGVDHYYEWMKKPSNVMKPVMVFLHGWAGSARYWQSTAEALLDNFDCLKEKYQRQKYLIFKKIGPSDSLSINRGGC